jgi:hypothetical protein
MSSLKETVVAALILFVVAYLVLHLAGCAGLRSDVAEATYLGQQLECVDKFATRKQIDACRADVRRKWGITETTRDGGAE